MNVRTYRYAVLQSFSLVVASFTLLSAFAVSTGIAGRFHAVPAVLTLASAVALRYAAVYHQFTRSTRRKLALVPIALAFVASGAAALDSLLGAVSLQELRHVFQHGSSRPGFDGSLPAWWIAVVLALAGTLLLAGSAKPRSLSPYPKPTTIGETAMSPAYLGLACTVFGLWAVLFVGVAIQRVVVVAPVFEELLKFGIALIVGSVLFDRSLVARVGVAIVVGSLFGVAEHATTYPAEADATYLFRTAFHATTAALSVSTYTLFEVQGESRLCWIAPVYSILLHFFYNTFVVLSSVVSVLVFGTETSVVGLLYGVVAVLIAAGLSLLVGVFPRAIVAAHRPLEEVLSDLV